MLWIKVVSMFLIANWFRKGECQMCEVSSPLIGSEGNEVIVDGALTASSRYNNAVRASSSRLDTRGAWSAAQRQTATEWLQADLGDYMLVVSVTTQGRHIVEQWVSQYTLSYSNDTSDSSFQVLQDANRDDVVFSGNSDTSTRVTNAISEPFVARYVRIWPQLWSVWPSLRWELTGCLGSSAVPSPEVTEGADDAAITIATTTATQASQTELTCESTTPRISTVPDTSLSASSQYSVNTGPRYSRLDTLMEDGHHGAWSAARSNAFQWLKVDLGGNTLVLSVTTQGRNSVTQWVATYSLKYSDDDETYTDVLDDTGSEAVFSGNTDSDTKVTNILETPFIARYVQLVPASWFTWISLRWELNGCLQAVDTTTQRSDLTTTQRDVTTTQSDVTTTMAVDNDAETTASANVATTTPSSSDDVLTTAVPTDVLRCNATVALIAGVPDSRLKSSSHWNNNDNFDATESRLDNNGAWAAAVKNNAQWVQVDLGAEALLQSITTQGRHNVDQWLTRYTIGWSMTGFEFNHVTDGNENVIVFEANSDQSSHVTNMLPEPIRGRYIRLYPVAWNVWISMRWELYGCMLESDGTSDLREGSWWSDCGRSKYEDVATMASALRIVGGQNARYNEFPWQVSIQYSPGGNYFYHFCGGVIIHPMWVLTAAHCVNGRNPDTIRAVVGDHELNRYHGVERMHTIDAIFVHDLYGPPGAQYDHDIALLLLDHPISLSENVQPACEPEDRLYTGEATQVSGWGALEWDTSSFPTALQWVQLLIPSNAQCNTAFQALYPFWTPITANMVCAGVEDYTGRDSCQGDSGGPMVVQASDGRFDLVGLVSWGYRCAGGAPGVYARVSRYKQWVTDHMLQYTPAYFS